MSSQKKNTERNSSKFQFEKLSLTENVDITVYKDAIDFVFSDSDIRNIAISGAYGSGKSSVLAAYKKDNSQKKFMHISLAHFVPENAQTASHDATSPSPCCQQKNHDKQKTGQHSISTGKPSAVELEGKILNQLIHQLDARNIPQTNFRVKNTISPVSVAWNTVAVSLLIICLLHLILSYTWVNFVGTFTFRGLRAFLELSTTPISFLISGLVIFVICTVYIYFAIKAQRYNAAIRKLSLQGNEIELFEESNDSFFDKYLNEVLYLFENSGIDAIVFEDMDRYEMETIFERLREVNTLVNIRLTQKKKPIIRFIFLLRDDIFVSKDRTKFFDFIIPIVPVIDSSNSYEKLIEHLDRNNIRYSFSDEFLQGISLYIDDMRLLKNICNEYLIYHCRLGSINLDPEKLLSLITYKNIYPRDFGYLQRNLGYVHAVFASKKEIVDTQISDLENNKEQLSKFIQSVAQETLTSKTELMQAYAVLHLSDNTRNIRNMSTDSLDLSLRRVLSGTQLNVYEERIKQVEFSSAQKQAELQNKFNELEQKIMSIKGMRLFEIIPHERGSEILRDIVHDEEGLQRNYQDIKESQYFDLLKYLILNGYLDESYPDYMTYFYPNSLSRNDKNFLKRVLDRNGHDYSYRVDNPDLVISKLRVTDFDYNEVLNNSLLDHLLTHEDHFEKLQHFLGQIKKQRDFHFLRQYLESTSERKRFFEVFCKQWPGFFDYIVKKKELSPPEIKQFSIDILYYCDVEQISCVNIGNCLTGYISGCPDYLDISDPKIDRLVAGFTLLDVHFHTLDLTVSNRELFERVYQESLYSINTENIIMMLKFIHGVDDRDELLISSNYSYICNFPESPLYHYIERNIDDYVGMWLTTYRGAIHDHESYVIKLLNHQKVSDRFKEDYIAQLDTVLSSLRNIRDQQLWKLLLEKKLALHIEENIITYWEAQYELDPIVIRYINEFKKPIDFSECRKNFSQDLLYDFFVSLVKCNDIRAKPYKGCIVSLGLSWAEEFNIPGLSIDKVQILAENHVLQMTSGTLRFIRSNYADAIPTYIKSNYDDYTSIMTTQLMDQRELLMILDWSVSDESKKKLIDMAPSPISIVDNKYSPEISVYILQKKSKSSDIPLLYETYNNQPDLIKDHIYALAIKNIDSVIQGTIKTTAELKCRILNAGQITPSAKHRLLAAAIRSLPKEDVMLFLDAAQKHEFSKIFNRRTRPRIENNAQNKELLDIFKSKGWIASYSLNEDRSEFRILRPGQQSNNH